MEINKDCFAYNEEKKCCNALDKLYCKREECSFYKNRKELSRAYIENAVMIYSKYHK